MKRRFWGWMLVALSLFVSLPASAATLYAMVHLESLKQIKAQEKSGDELHIDIVDSYSNHFKKEAFVPSMPLYWRFTKHNSVKNITLWQGKLEEGASVDIVFTVLEHDLPPYNPDDRIGAMKLKLKNINGKLQSHWVNGLHTKSEPVKHQTDQIYPAIKFHMDGSGGIYEIVLRLRLS